MANEFFSIKFFCCLYFSGSVVQEISKIWRMGMTDEDRQYYNEFAIQAKEAYQKQHIEYRATGEFTLSKDFKRMDGVNVWVRSAWHENNGLEREIAGYDTFSFPKRPAEFDEEYEKRAKESVQRRKLKLKGLLNEDGTVKEGVDGRKSHSSSTEPEEQGEKDEEKSEEGGEGENYQAMESESIIEL
jgi:hypothetical protein